MAEVKPAPPPWPERGTPEYEARILKMRQGHAARLAKGPQTKPAARTAPLVGEADLIDVGEPNAARMAPEARQDAKTKGKALASRGKGEFEQSQVHKNLKLGLDILSRMPGHEHWQRDDDEVELIAEPATRCLNRLDKKLIERLRTVSDPAALVFACVMVLGPSIGEELKNVGTRQKGSARPGAEQRQQPQYQPPAGQAEPWAGGGDFADTSHLQGNGAVPIPVPADLPLTGY